MSFQRDVHGWYGTIGSERFNVSLDRYRGYYSFTIEAGSFYRCFTWYR